MKMIKFLLILSALAVLSTPLYARDTSSGCGIGWEVNGDNSFLGTSLRGTTHAMFPPTFSMTFGTSGCARHSIAEKDLRGIEYATVNFASLETDISRGQGDTLTGFAAVMGCSPVQTTFNQILQEKFVEIVPSSEITPEDLYWNVLYQVQTDSRLSGSCATS